MVIDGAIWFALFGTSQTMFPTRFGRSNVSLPGRLPLLGLLGSAASMAPVDGLDGEHGARHGFGVSNSLGMQVLQTVAHI